MKSAAALAMASILGAPFLAVGTQQPLERTDRESYGLMGPVKTFRDERCTLREDPDHPGEFIEDEHRQVYTLTFDLGGRKIKQDPPPCLCDSGFLIDAQKRDKKFDDKGRLVEETGSTLEGELLFRYTYMYDSKGKIAMVANYSADGTVQYKVRHNYDANGNEIETFHYGKGSRLDERRFLVLDDHGNIIGRTVYDAHGTITETAVITREYDSYGNWTKATESELKGSSNSSFIPVRVEYQILTYYGATETSLARD